MGTAGSPRSAFGLDMYYCANHAASCSTNTGNLVTATASVLNMDQQFANDPIHRWLVRAFEGLAASPVWSEGFAYDDEAGKLYGNRRVTSSSGLSLEASTPTVATNFDINNRLQINGRESKGEEAVAGLDG